jgi:2-keto-4-pentenoate hydratase/2-oxohepta-3-ene-1,7-dioic acid hydratase in catechol pathway
MRRFYRIEHNGSPRHVVEEGDSGEWHLVEGDIFGSWKPGAALKASGQRVLAPIMPSKIVAVGLNYKDHAAEVKKPLPAEPLLFLKPSTAVIGPGDSIVIPDGAGRIDHEAEMGVVIGSTARAVPEGDASKYVFGITCVNDITARELQAKDIQYTRAKGFDTFAPVGPCIATGLPFDSADGLTVEGWVNGTRRQFSSTRELIFPVAKLVAFISAIMTLLPGDIITTGTPSGIGPLSSGDRVTIKVEGVGELTNPVANRNR